MGLNTDATAIQWRLLNASKGPSVRAPRAQCDKKAYQFRIKNILETSPRIDLHQGNATRLLLSDSAIEGVQTNLQFELRSRAVVLSAGTFMRGLMHVGRRNEQGAAWAIPFQRSAILFSSLDSRWRDSKPAPPVASMAGPSI